MDAPTRRAVAYIAGRVTSQRAVSAVYDYEAGRYTNFSGNISPSNISVYDFDCRCHISGTQKNGHLSLYHHGSAGHIDLNLRPGGSFSGYDYASSSHFSGTVKGTNISLYDYSSGKYFNYSI
jgi:hypothetical protein